MNFLSVRKFAKSLARFYPTSYSQALGWADSGELPTWPRLGNEPYRVRLDARLRDFLLSRGLDEQTASCVMTELEIG